MNRILLSYLAAGCSIVAAKAAPTDDIKAAIQGLSTSANYTWTTTTTNNGGGGGGRGGFGGPATGMTQKDGLTVITREFNGNKMSTVSMGDKVVRQNQDGVWMTNDEMMAQFQNGGGGGGRRGRGGFGAMGATTIPAKQAADLLAGVKGDFMIINGGFSGDLAPESVAPMLTFGRGRRGGGGDGQAPPAPANAKGTVTFWVTGGVLTKYEVHVTGTVQGRNGDMDVDRTTTTEIKDVGATKLDVPAEAMQKLNG
jgi:hypothetical protein